MCEGGRPEMASRRRVTGLSLAEEEAAGGGGGAEGMRTRRPRGWTAVAFIFGFFAAASIAANSFVTPLTSYLISRYNMKENAATNLNNVFSGMFSFAPVVGAFVADAFWGRFKTMLFGSVVGVIGMVVITLSATIRQLKPPTCSAAARQSGTCAGPSALHRAVLYVGMGLLVVSAGGMNPTALPFGADQFDETDQRHKAGLTRYFNGYYAMAMLATFVALTAIVYLQDKVSWGLGFAIPTALMLAVFLAGTALYVRVPPEGSIFSSVARVAVASCRKWRLRLPHPDDARRQEEVLYNPDPAAGGGNNSGRRRVFRLPLTLQLSFLNKAAIVTDAGDEVRADGSPARPWSLCSVQQVEEAKCLVKIAPLWVSGVAWFVVLTEMSNYTYIQATTMDLHIGSHFNIPAVSILAVFNLSVAVIAPLFDLLASFAARRLNKQARGGVTLLQRQGAGLVIGALAFVVAAGVERRRRGSALGHGDGRSPLSVFLLAPQLAMMGASGALSMVGQMEFYNTQFPDQMRTMANAAFYCAQGASSYLATLVISVVNGRTRRRGGAADGWVSDDINAGRLDYFYYTMAVLGAVNFVYFLVCSNFYRYKDEQAAEPAGPELPSDGSSLRTSSSGPEVALRKT
ncbi:unnamed protein product [Urochloa humidicola]